MRKVLRIKKTDEEMLQEFVRLRIEIAEPLGMVGPEGRRVTQRLLRVSRELADVLASRRCPSRC